MRRRRVIRGAIVLAVLLVGGGIVLLDLPRIRIVKAERALHRKPNDLHALLLLVTGLAERGEVARARKALRAVEGLQVEDPFDLIGVGVAFLRIGDEERAFLYLNRAATIGGTKICRALRHVLFDPIRARIASGEC